MRQPRGVVAKHPGLWSPGPRFESARGYMISVLRLGHRVGRDERISTHCGLVARAFGADEIIYTGEEDKGLIESVMNVVKKWGGNFSAKYEKSYRKVINEYKSRGFKIIHLTMYGIPIQDVAKNLKGDLMIVIGGEKVPPDIYDLSDFNIAVTNQPHSEVAALAIALDRIFDGAELSKEFEGGMKIIPQKRGKKVIKPWKKETSSSTEHVQKL